jgi:F-box domain
MKPPVNPRFDMWTNFLPEIRREILQYLDEDDLGELSMVSRQCRDACKDPALPQTRRAVIRCDPDSGNRYHYLHPLGAALLKVPTKTNGYKKSYTIFQERFTHFKIENPSAVPKIMNREAKPIMSSLTMAHVTHLDLSSSERSRGGKTRQGFPLVAPSITKLMHHIVPEIQVLDLSHNQVSTATVADASRNYKKLETIRLVGGLLASSITGMDLKQCESLKELYLDHTLVTASAKEEKDIFENADEEQACPFSYCLRNLERVSLKGCLYFNMTAKAEDHAIHGKPFSQVGLIKFVRKATNLQWFHSDLTAENVEMLQAERPDVVFVGHEG